MNVTDTKTASDKPLSVIRVLIVGNPNVGKSVLFNALTGQYATVSNYPGTSIEVSRGELICNGRCCEISDTPGTYSLFPVTEDERVTRQILMQARPDAVVHVTDAKNLERMLPFTLQLLEAGLPVLLVLNMMDEARIQGVLINIPVLAERLGIPVIGTVATSGEGIDLVRMAVTACPAPSLQARRVTYSENMETAIAQIMRLLPVSLPNHISRRAWALFLLADDDEISNDVCVRDPAASIQIRAIVENLRQPHQNPLGYAMAVQQKQMTQRLLDQVLTTTDVRSGFKEWLSRLTMHPLAGPLILWVVLYWGLYRFVGGFGAGTVVDFLEGVVFEKHLNPVLTAFFTSILPWRVLQDLFVGEYGLITLGLRYTFALIMPIVTFFFLVFAVIEDTGYLPRLAMLIDRIFKKIGLSGRAVIPMVLGLGCATMATMVTRTLPTKRERVISTLLLALAVPCSAQLGVILALMEGRPKVMLVWAVVVALVFMVVGRLSAELLPGKPASFYMEVPPLRLPKLLNVLTKTYVRVVWYLKEILPLFLAASILIWLGQITRLFDVMLQGLAKPVALIGLPSECAKIFLFGFFRRDYGAAGLYDLNKQHLLNNGQIAVACVALTLFLPCVAQLLMNIKERGWKTGVAISVITILVSFSVAFLLNVVLVRLQVNL